MAFQRATDRLAETLIENRALVVEPLDVAGRVFAAVDRSGAWALVVRVRKSGSPIPALKLSSLSVDYGASYRLHGTTTVEGLRVAVIRCASDDAAVRVLFATFCVALLDDLRVDPSDLDLEREVGKWLSLFWRLREPARTSVVGLIGELSLLDRVDDLAAWVRAWHRASTDNLDFEFETPKLSVEVKATTSQQRIHEVSVHQLTPVEKHRHYFASVIVELRESGVRLGDLVDELAGKLAATPELPMFWRALIDVCGESLGQYLDERFMRETASTSLTFYHADAVPRPVMELPLPAGVLGVRFRSDFASSDPVPPAVATELLSVSSEVS